MKFTFDRDAILKEISIAQEIINNKSPLAVHSYILLNAFNNTLNIKATDSVMKFSSTIPIDIQEEGTTTIYCDKFMSILSSLPPGEIEFSQNEEGITIKPLSKKVKFQLKSLANDKFPEIGNVENVPYFEFSSKDFKEMIKETVFAVSDDAQRFFMTGVYFCKKDNDLIMVATDGRRLSFDSKKDVSVPDFTPVIIPTKILNCVLKHAPEEGNIQIAVIERSILFKFANVEFSSNLVDGQYPNYQKVIPEGLTKSFMVNKADLEAALKRTVIMVDRTLSKIIFKISSGVLKIISPDSKFGNADEEIPCRYDGPNISMSMNYTYLIDPLRVTDSENVVFNFNINEVKGEDEVNITKAIIIEPDSSADYFHVIMPMNY